MKAGGRRIWKWAAFLFAGLLIVGLSGYFFILPWFVHRQIISQLASMGLPNTSLTLKRLTPWSLELDHISLGGANRLGQVSVSYTPASVLHGRVHRVVVSGIDIALDLRNGRVNAGDLSKLKLPASDGRTPLTDLPFDQIQVNSSSCIVQLSDRAVRIPAEGTIARGTPGVFDITLGLGLQPSPLLLRGSYEPASMQLKLDADGKKMDAAMLAALVTSLAPGKLAIAKGSFDLAAHMEMSGAGSKSYSAELEPRGLGMVARKNALSIEGIGGKISVRATGSKNNPMAGSVSVQDLSFSEKTTGLQATGINGSVELVDLVRTVTPPAQQMEFKTLTVGKASFSDGKISFAVDDAQVLHVARAQLGWLGGQIWAETFTVGQARPTFDATIHVVHVDLHELLESFAQGKASGEGNISGEMPLIIDGSDFKFGHGTLQADPGGTMKVQEFAALSAALDQAGASDANLKQKVYRALADFRYDLLGAMLSNDHTGMLASVHLVGRGQTGERTPLDLEMNVTGISDALKLYLGYERWMAALGAG